MQRTFLTVVVGLFVSGSAWAGTYEDLQGNKRPLKNLSGKEHPFEGHVGPGENLSRADLEEANLAGANLAGANLRKANLRGVDLTATNLSKADLAAADLSKADLDKADLSRADLSGADLRGATHWNKADWRNASYFHRRKPKWPAEMDPKKFGITVYPPEKKK
jgi:uncharacterized protein YjbI with pentapeptide repeats